MNAPIAHLDDTYIASIAEASMGWLAAPGQEVVFRDPASAKLAWARLARDEQQALIATVRAILFAMAEHGWRFAPPGV